MIDLNANHKMCHINNMLDYLNIDNSIAYTESFNKNNSFENIMVELSGLKKEAILKKYYHIEALDNFLYQKNH